MPYTLPANVQTARASSGNWPVLLIEIVLTAGTIRLAYSATGFTIEGVHYGGGLIRRIRSIRMGRTMEANAMLFELENGPFYSSSERFTQKIKPVGPDPFEGASVLVYQIFEPITLLSDRVLIFKGRAQDPQYGTDNTFSFSAMDIVATRNKVVGLEITRGDFTTAPEESIGKAVPVPYGDQVEYPIVQVSGGGVTKLARTLRSTDTAIVVEDATLFSTSGAVVIDEELILYTTRNLGVTPHQFTGLTRTEAKDHAPGAVVEQYATTDYAFSLFPVKSTAGQMLLSAEAEGQRVLLATQGTDMAVWQSYSVTTISVGGYSVQVLRFGSVVSGYRPRVRIRENRLEQEEIQFDNTSGSNVAGNLGAVVGIKDTFVWNEKNYVSLKSGKPTFKFKRAANDVFANGRILAEAFLIVDFNTVNSSGLAATAKIGSTTLGTLVRGAFPSIKRVVDTIISNQSTPREHQTFGGIKTVEGNPDIWVYDPGPGTGDSGWKITDVPAPFMPAATIGGGIPGPQSIVNGKGYAYQYVSYTKTYGSKNYSFTGSRKPKIKYTWGRTDHIGNDEDWVKAIRVSVKHGGTGFQTSTYAEGTTTSNRKSFFLKMYVGPATPYLVNNNNTQHSFLRAQSVKVDSSGWVDISSRNMRVKDLRHGNTRLELDPNGNFPLELQDITVEFQLKTPEDGTDPVTGAQSYGSAGADNTDAHSVAAFRLETLATDAINDWTDIFNKQFEISVSSFPTGSEFRIYGVHLLVTYWNTKVVPAEKIFVKLDGIQDDSLGTYSGTANAILNKPGSIMHHALRNLMGYSASDVDPASFDTLNSDLNASLGSGTFTWAGVLRDLWDTIDLLRQWSTEARCTLFHKAGVITARFMPTAVGTADKTLTNADLTSRPGSGETIIPHVSIRHSPLHEVVNNLAVFFAPDNTRDGVFRGLSTAVDSGSVNDYGTLKGSVGMIETGRFHALFISASAMAANIRDWLLARYKTPKRVITVEADIAQLELHPGDSMDLTTDLNITNLEGIVEEVERDGGSADVTGGVQRDRLTFTVREF